MHTLMSWKILLRGLVRTTYDWSTLITSTVWSIIPQIANGNKIFFVCYAGNTYAVAHHNHQCTSIGRHNLHFWKIPSSIKKNVVLKDQNASVWYNHFYGIHNNISYFHQKMLHLFLLPSGAINPTLHSCFYEGKSSCWHHLTLFVLYYYSQSKKEN